MSDSFSIDEYDNTLRLVTTVTHNVGSSSQSNSVYVLDADLKTIGKIEDLAKDEQVYSARFLGDTGYFVTYEQTDPLFSVDFSDPENPKMEGRDKFVLSKGHAVPALYATLAERGFYDVEEMMTVRMSVADREPPGWPEPASWMARMTSTRILRAVSFSSS